MDSRLTSRKFILTGAGGLLGAVAPFVTEVDPALAFKGILFLIALYTAANVALYFKK